MRPLAHAVSVVLLLPGVLVAAPGPEQRITASDADNSDRFGHAVDIYGDIAVVGAPGDDQEGVNAGAAYVFRRTGAGWVEEAKLTAGVDAGPFDEFGWDVAVERDLIVVGSPNDDEAAGGGSDSGAAYIFEWNGALWQQIAKLLPDDPSNAGYTFGVAVDIGIAVPDEHPPLELTNVAVGAPRADSFEGAVFLYQRSGASWNRIGRLADSDQGGPNDNGEFGTALAIRGDSLLVGAPLDDQLGSNAGAAYLFGRGQIIDSWVEAAALYPSDPVPGGQFGAAVAVDRLFDLYTYVVGAPASLTGAAPGRIFIGDTAGDPTILTAGGNQDDFGAAVAVDGDRLVVGAPGDSEHGDDAGAVYFFFRDAPGSWHPDGRITASDAGNQREFGESVASHASIVVGSPQEDAFLPGAAYLYSTIVFADDFESGDTSAWSTVTP